jgi:hypothetical protein
MKTQAFFIDLTQRPPRSFRVRLGGFVILARMIDKGRATLSKKNGEYCQLWRKAVNPARQHESSLKSPLAARVSEKRGLSHGTCRSPQQSQITSQAWPRSVLSV